MEISEPTGMLVNLDAVFLATTMAVGVGPIPGGEQGLFLIFTNELQKQVAIVIPRDEPLSEEILDGIIVKTFRKLIPIDNNLL